MITNDCHSETDMDNKKKFAWCLSSVYTDSEIVLWDSQWEHMCF